MRVENETFSRQYDTQPNQRQHCRIENGPRRIVLFALWKTSCLFDSVKETNVGDITTHTASSKEQEDYSTYSGCLMEARKGNGIDAAAREEG